MFAGLESNAPEPLRLAGVVAGFALAVWLARRDRLPLERFYLATVYALGAAVGGAKLAVLAEHWGEAPAAELVPRVLLTGAGSSFGALAAAILAGFIVVPLLGLPFWRTADVFAPALAIGLAFARVGCFLGGCCYGTSCVWPWGVEVPLEASLRSAAPLGVPLHPVQLYETALCAALAVSLVVLVRRGLRPGTAFAVFLTSYGAARFVLELWRGDHAPGFSSAQAWSLAAVAAGLAVIAVTRGRKDEDAEVALLSGAVALTIEERS